MENETQPKLEWQKPEIMDLDIRNTQSGAIYVPYEQRDVFGPGS